MTPVCFCRMRIIKYMHVVCGTYSMCALRIQGKALNATQSLFFLLEATTYDRGRKKTNKLELQCRGQSTHMFENALTRTIINPKQTYLFLTFRGRNFSITSGDVTISFFPIILLLGVIYLIRIGKRNIIVSVGNLFN